MLRHGRSQFFAYGILSLLNVFALLLLIGAPLLALALRSFTEDMRSRGLVPSSRVISVAEVQAAHPSSHCLHDGFELASCRAGGSPASSSIAVPRVPGSHTAAIGFTSGSTGVAKAITKTLRCLDAEIQTLEMLWGKTLENAAVFTTVSHQHIYGLLFRLLWPLCAERPFAATAHSYPEQLVAELQQQTRTVLISSP